MILFEGYLQGVPVAKGRPRMGKFGMYTPTKTSKAEKDIRLQLAPKMPRIRYQGPVAVTTIFAMPIPSSWSKKKREEMLCKPHTQKPDMDNLQKLVYDAINPIRVRKKGMKDMLVGGMIEDDSQICKATSSKVWSDTPSTYLKVETIE